MRAIKVEKKQLKEQKEEADNYLAAKEELAKKKTKLWLYRL